MGKPAVIWWHNAEELIQPFQLINIVTSMEPTCALFDCELTNRARARASHAKAAHPDRQKTPAEAK
jgi:hypothetical protein